MASVPSDLRTSSSAGANDMSPSAISFGLIALRASEGFLGECSGILELFVSGRRDGLFLRLFDDQADKCRRRRI